MAGAGLDEVLSHLKAGRERAVEDLQAFVRIPSVSADPAHEGDMARAAQWLMTRFDQAGLRRVRLAATDGQPAVIAQWTDAGKHAPTVLVYGHYDVQPANAADGWTDEPFSGALRDGRVMGRGASDMKGQLLCHLHAVDAWLKTADRLPVNIVFVVEGEEEVGSPHFATALERAVHDIEPDLVLISDAPMRDPGTPTVGYSVRGLVYFEIHVTGPTKDLHSGVFGGVVRNPLDALVAMLASLKDPRTGAILPDGFHDGMRDVDDAELARLKAQAEPAERIMQSAGVKELWCDADDVQACLGLRPTLEIHGIWGGYSGPGSKTVIPASAHAKLSARIVADQDPHDVAKSVVAHLRERVPKGVEVHMDILHTVPPVREDPDDPVLEPVLQSLEAAWGKPAVRVPVGGSIGAMSVMDRRLAAKPYLVAFGNWDDGMHGPDESFRTDILHKGGEAMARMLENVAKHSQRQT